MPTQLNKPLAVKVRDGQLVISIGVNTLCKALVTSPDPYISRITNRTAFVKEIAARLENDGDEQETKLTRLLDEAAQSAVECGSRNVELIGDSQPSVYPPERT